MTNAKKSIRNLTVLALVFVMVFSIFSLTVSAVGGPEDWYKGSSSSQTLSIDGYNTTYKKTIKESGTLTVSAYFTPSDKYSYNTYTLEILDASTNTIVGTFKDSVLTSKTVTVSTNVTAGQVIYIRMGSFERGTQTGTPASVKYTRTLS